MFPQRETPRWSFPLTLRALKPICIIISMHPRTPFPWAKKAIFNLRARGRRRAYLQGRKNFTSLSLSLSQIYVVKRRPPSDNSKHILVLRRETRRRRRVYLARAPLLAVSQHTKRRMDGNPYFLHRAPNKQRRSSKERETWWKKHNLQQRFLQSGCFQKGFSLSLCFCLPICAPVMPSAIWVVQLGSKEISRSLCP